MASAVDYPQQPSRPFQYHRKPVPTQASAGQRLPSYQTPAAADDHYSRLQAQLQQQQQQQQTPSPQSFTPAQPMNLTSTQAQMSQFHPTRRTLSNATASTDSTSGAGRQDSMASSLQRTTSSRSGTQPVSYVALMRKQKATVWSDRSQHEDPRMVAQQRAARVRAEREISKANTVAARAANSGSGSLTSGVRSRIRHHGAPKAQQYAPRANLAGGVPMRLSAREVGDDDSDDDATGRPSASYQRNESARSSFGSSRHVSSTPGAPHAAAGSSGSTPPSGPHSGAQSPGAAPAEQHYADGPTPVPAPQRERADYFKDAPRPLAIHKRVGSGASERENSFGDVGGLPAPRAQRDEGGASAEDLQRRGSVDERTTTMSGYGRLFIANPDQD